MRNLVRLVVLLGKGALHVGEAFLQTEITEAQLQGPKAGGIERSPLRSLEWRR